MSKIFLRSIDNEEKSAFSRISKVNQLKQGDKDFSFLFQNINAADVPTRISKNSSFPVQRVRGSYREKTDILPIKRAFVQTGFNIEFGSNSTLMPPIKPSSKIAESVSSLISSHSPPYSIHRPTPQRGASLTDVFQDQNKKEKVQDIISPERGPTNQTNKLETDKLSEISVKPLMKRNTSQRAYFNIDRKASIMGSKEKVEKASPTKISVKTEPKLGKEFSFGLSSINEGDNTVRRIENALNSKRQTRNNDQKQILMEEFIKDPAKWSIQKCHTIGLATGLGYQQISKWNWDQRSRNNRKSYAMPKETSPTKKRNQKELSKQQKPKASKK